MTDLERKYAVCEYDASTGSFSLNTFRVYLLSASPFVLVIDHAALIYALKKNT